MCINFAQIERAKSIRVRKTECVTSTVTCDRNSDEVELSATNKKSGIDRPESSAKLHQQSGQGDKNRGNIGSGRRWIRGVLATVLHSVSGHPLHGTGTTGRSHESLDLARYVYLYINFHEIANSWKCCKHCRRILLHFGNCETRHYFVL